MTISRVHYTLYGSVHEFNSMRKTQKKNLIIGNCLIIFTNTDDGVMFHGKKEDVALSNLNKRCHSSFEGQTVVFIRYLFKYTYNKYITLNGVYIIWRQWPCPSKKFYSNCFVFKAGRYSWNIYNIKYRYRRIYIYLTKMQPWLEFKLFRTCDVAPVSLTPDDIIVKKLNH